MIAEYYRDKEIFLTGGSGVLGRGIIEKLLRSTQIKALYVLLRVKKGIPVHERLETLKNGLVFKRLRSENPSALDKLKAIPGDITEPLLGISEDCLESIKNVSIFIHSAATVRFDEPLRKAIQINVGGTYEVIKVAEKMDRIDQFVHISTFYSNPYLKLVENKMYPPPMDWRIALQLLQCSLPDDVINIFTSKFLGAFPNTYTFTKNLSENVVNDHHHLFPVLIVRPSVIAQSLTDPEPGYVESFYGATGIIAMFGTGLYRTTFGRGDVQLDIIYLDLVVKMLLLKIYDLASSETIHCPETKIMLVCGGVADPYNYYDKMKYCREAMERYAFVKCFWYPGNISTTFYPYYLWRVYIYQLAPSLFLDLTLKLLGKPPIAMALQRRAHTGNMELKHFLSNTFQNNGIDERKRLSEVAMNTDFNLSEYEETMKTILGRHQCYGTFILGIRRHLLKEDDCTIPTALIKFKILKLLDYLLRTLLYYHVGKMALRYLYKSEYVLMEMGK